MGNEVEEQGRKQLWHTLGCSTTGWEELKKCIGSHRQYSWLLGQELNKMHLECNAGMLAIQMWYLIHTSV